MIHKNIETDFSPEARNPQISKSSFVHPLAAVIGNVYIGHRVMVSPFASVRGDEGQPIFVDDESNIQDGVIIHALETFRNGKQVDKNLIVKDGKGFAVHIGKRVSLAHQSQIHGPAAIGSDSFIGMQSLIFHSMLGEGCVVEPGCLVMNVSIESGRFIPAGIVVKRQSEADILPVITDTYVLKDLNKDIVHVNTALAEGYIKSETN